MKDGPTPPVQFPDADENSKLVKFFGWELDFEKAAVNALLIISGSIIYMLGVNGLLVPHGFLNGGTLGIAMILAYLKPGLNLGIMYFILNVPLFLLGWFKVSHRFIHYTGFGIVAFSITAELVKVPSFGVIDPILAAILAGIICGCGAGLILRSSGSAGGLDILGVFLYKRYGLPMGYTSFLCNAGVLAVAGLFFGIDIALYTLIFIFTQGKIMDAVLTGFNRRKAVIIISDHSREIATAIMTILGRGATFLEGSGAYSNQARKVVFSVITMTEMGRLRTVVLGIDPNAFIVINDTLDVWGSTMGKPRDY